MISSVQLCALLHYVGHGPFVESSVFREHDSIPCVGLDWPTPRIRRHETDRQVVSWVTSCGATLKRSTVDAKTPSRSLICELCSNMDPATSGDCLEACQRRISLSNLWDASKRDMFQDAWESVEGVIRSSWQTVAACRLELTRDSDKMLA